MVAEPWSVSMEEVVKKRKHKAPSKAAPKSRKVYDKSFRLRLVKLHVEDGHTIRMLADEGGISRQALCNWIKKYREQGEAGLSSQTPVRGPKRQSHPIVDEKIIELKKEYPNFGVRKIAEILRRWHFLPVEKTRVHTVLTDAGLQQGPKRKRQRNAVKPRRFERSTPNQMWQSDIMMFRMGGRQVYLIGFVDDYSRYMTGLELYMSQTADNLIELYRRSTAEYSIPTEMLTDNGRQYVNWRGESKFQKELTKDRVKHIRSTPHHPMTLGKIERFWQTIFDEFLCRAQFESFDSARERIRLWVQYYNHKRPHQGIGGLCPADRFFEISSEVRKTVEAGIQENILELALRGKPKEPFYMVGRMDGQSIVMRAEKGKLKLTVGNELCPSGEEQEFIIEKEKDHATGDDKSTGSGHAEIGALAGGTADNGIGTDGGNLTAEVQYAVENLFVGAEGGSGVEGMGGTSDTGADLSGIEYHMDYIESVAGTRSGRDAAGTGAACAVGEGRRIESSSAVTAREETDGDFGSSVAEKDPQNIGEIGSRRLTHERSGEGGGPAKRDSFRVEREDVRDGRSEETRVVPEGLLRVGESRLESDAGGSRGSSGWSSGGTGRSGEGDAARRECPTPDGAGNREENDRSENGVGRLRTAAEIALERLCCRAR